MSQNSTRPSTSRTVYVVEIDGQQYDIEGGDVPPTEAEARAAIRESGSQFTEPAAHTSAHTPPQRGAVARFLEPIGAAARALPDMVGLAAEAGRFPATAVTDPARAAALVRAARDAVMGPQLEQADKAGAAFGEGRYSEALGHGAAAVLPVVGPAAAEIGETAGEGNVAGALGQAALLAAPVGKMPVNPKAISRLLKSRAAARILDVMRPSSGKMKAAKEVALEVAEGTAGRGTAGGIGVGSLKTLTERAKARAAVAGKEVESLQALDTPVRVGPVTRELRQRASRLETVPPAHEVLEEVPTGLFDAAGDPIMGIKSETVKGVPTSEYPQLVGAYREQARHLDDLAAQFEGEAIPAGELFKQRAALGRRFGKSYEKLPGDEPAAAATAGRDARSLISDLVHDEGLWGEGGLGGSKIIDRDNRVWKTAAVNLERAGLRNTHSLQGLKQLLIGRAAGAAMGAAAGTATMGPLGGVAGALTGVALGESAYWGSLRAATYAKLARALNAGHLDDAADIIQRTAAAYAADRGIHNVEKRRKAEAALRSQAEGVVAP